MVSARGTQGGDGRGNHSRHASRPRSQPQQTNERQRFSQPGRGRGTGTPGRPGEPGERRRGREHATTHSGNEPRPPEEFVETELPFGVRAELKSLPKDLADRVGAHIWAAGQLIDIDPRLAFEHAEAARRRAGRLPVVREAAAETAYACGEFAVALREFRAIRRMSGGDELLPVIADCERALGRPRDALEVLASVDPGTRDTTLRIECTLVEAGIRDDLGQRAEARRLLKTAISRGIGTKQAQARLHYAYANLLEADGDLSGARHWFTTAAGLDTAIELDTSDRVAKLDGVTLPDFSDDDHDEDDEGETR